MQRKHVNQTKNLLSVNKQRRTTEFPNNLLEQTEKKGQKKVRAVQWAFELEKQKFEKEVEVAKISLCVKKLKT